MNELFILSVLWVVIGAVVVYYVDKRSYNEGMLDAIVMHNRGQLTYTSYFDDDGFEMIEMEVKPNEG